ncbi:unnamed protein product [Cuscuta epithymum]|uniref:Uncharacterized protein n=1 Tax=Cuscuta epithymum TaxID=186058 RepID=A0AAV0GGW7_9ASTE|nr:unnamed protein product [Cuscuta epithymum]
MIDFGPHRNNTATQLIGQHSFVAPSKKAALGAHLRPGREKYTDTLKHVHDLSQFWASYGQKKIVARGPLPQAFLLEASRVDRSDRKAEVSVCFLFPTSYSANQLIVLEDREDISHATAMATTIATDLRFPAIHISKSVDAVLKQHHDS